MEKYLLKIHIDFKVCEIPKRTKTIVVSIETCQKLSLMHVCFLRIEMKIQSRLNANQLNDDYDFQWKM